MNNVHPRLGTSNVLPLWLLIAAVALLAYGRTAMFEFVTFDDDLLITGRAAYLSTPSTFVDAFRRDYWFGSGDYGWRVYYRPMVTESYVLDAQIAPASPLVGHGTNIALHVLASLLLFTLLTRITASRDTSLLLSLLFAAHPLASNAVGWIPGRNDSLMAVFVLATMIAFLAHLRSGSIRSLVGFAAACFGAVFTKEPALILPAVLVGWSAVDRDEWKRLRWLPPALVAAGLSAAWWIVRSSVITADRQFAVGSAWENLPLLVQGIGKIMLPFNLAAVATIADTGFMWGLVAVAGIAFMVLRTSAPDIRLFVRGAMWYLLFLAPATFTGQGGTTMVLECRLYLPMIGIVIMLAGVGPVRSFAWDGKKNIVGAGIVAMLVALSWWFSEPYHDPRALWTHAAATSPSSPVVHLRFGMLLESDGHLADAEHEYREAARLDPHNAFAHSYVGRVLLARGERDSAEAEYRAQLEIRHDSPFALQGLSAIALQRGDLPRATTYLERCVDANPTFSQGWNALTELYMRGGNRNGVVRCARHLQAMGVPVSIGITTYLQSR